VPWPLYASTIFRTGVWHVLGAFIIVPFVFSMPSHALLLDIIGFEYESTMLHVTAFNALVKGELAYWIPHIILAFLCSYLHGWSLYDHYLEAKKSNGNLLYSDYLEGQQKQKAVLDAVTKGNIVSVKQQLAAGVDVNTEQFDGLTLLHLTASAGHKEIVELLLSEDADVNAKTVHCQTPLDLVDQADKAGIADFLRKHGGKTGEELIAEDN